VNLRKVSHLRVFSLYSIIKCKAPHFAVLHDINIVLGTIPESNKFTNLAFNFTILGRKPFRKCLDQDWDGMYNEVIRISDRKPLEVEIQMSLSLVYLEVDCPGQDELFKYIMDKAGSLSDYPNICTHFARGRPFLHGHVRSRCRR
jgi:hypothetical protein